VLPVVQGNSLYQPVTRVFINVMGDTSGPPTGSGSSAAAAKPAGVVFVNRWTLDNTACTAAWSGVVSPGTGSPQGYNPGCPSGDVNGCPYNPGQLFGNQPPAFSVGTCPAFSGPSQVGTIPYSTGSSPSGKVKIGDAFTISSVWLDFGAKPFVSPWGIFYANNVDVSNKGKSSCALNPKAPALFSTVTYTNIVENAANGVANPAMWTLQWVLAATSNTCIPVLMNADPINGGVPAAAAHRERGSRTREHRCHDVPLLRFHGYHPRELTGDC